MNNIELAELVNSTDMYEVAYKTARNMNLNDDESAVAEQLDKHFREIGKKGHDTENEIASFVQKVVTEEIYNTPDELLDMLFDRGTIGVYDDFQSVTTPKNTLVAYDAAKGGNVPRSFLDVRVITPKWRNKQIETDLSFSDVARNGWKSISLLTDYATSAFKNAMFADIFSDIDAGIVSGAANYIDAAGTMPTSTEMDAMVLYINEHTDMVGAGAIVGLYKYIQAASKFNSFISDDIVNEVHRTGRLGVYDGVSMVPISSAKKLGNGDLLIPDKRLFGICNKVGTLNMKGDINVYQTEDSNKEVFNLKFKDFTFGYAFNAEALENVIKMDLS